MECIFCGCDAHHACELQSGEPCAWFAPFVCTACVYFVMPDVLEPNYPPVPLEAFE